MNVSTKFSKISEVSKVSMISKVSNVIKVSNISKASKISKVNKLSKISKDSKVIKFKIIMFSSGCSFGRLDCSCDNFTESLCQKSENIKSEKVKSPKNVKKSDIVFLKKILSQNNPPEMFEQSFLSTLPQESVSVNSRNYLSQSSKNL